MIEKVLLSIQPDLNRSPMFDLCLLQYYLRYVWVPVYDFAISVDNVSVVLEVRVLVMDEWKKRIHDQFSLPSKLRSLKFAVSQPEPVVGGGTIAFVEDR